MPAAPPPSLVVRKMPAHPEVLLVTRPVKLVTLESGTIHHSIHAYDKRKQDFYVCQRTNQPTGRRRRQEKHFNNIVTLPRPLHWEATKRCIPLLAGWLLAELCVTWVKQDVRFDIGELLIHLVLSVVWPFRTEQRCSSGRKLIQNVVRLMRPRICRRTDWVGG